ncbi:unnamed protein product [Prunus armeniaca]
MSRRDSLATDERLNALEEEVRLLWAASRKYNFDLHVLESKAQDDEDRLETVASQAPKMADIVTEQWIQIQRGAQHGLSTNISGPCSAKHERLGRAGIKKLAAHLCFTFMRSQLPYLGKTS